MKPNVINVCKGEYSNSDAYESTIYYACSKNYIGGYGFPLPAAPEEIIRYFYYAQEASNFIADRSVWHFNVSIADLKNHTTYLLLADAIASLFAKNYQVLYSLDLEPGRYHLHFVVNNYSYHPDTAVLTPERFYQYNLLIEEIIQNLYPYNHIINEWKKEFEKTCLKHTTIF